ncbi:carbohydrate ABC transporter permease [Spiractinospora alimapuensis]|uniref:carbohydrate ABC transporter permease n=1 Tax=Spiractinospora alimapuensis TaxID=2820884 RepID=UPI001F1626ED|nr:carbohydrate ABC transporter permease [Spiractinospora alimapuensis]QVQ50496.1 carbohydrate ABC transporter permease [Spiractinospora alimapuensis]
MTAAHDAQPTLARRRRRSAVGNIAKLVGLALVLVWCLFPFLWMAMTSLRGGAIALTDPNILVGPFRMTNYQDVVGQGFHFALRNSLIVAGVTTLIGIPVAALAGYTLARLPLRGRYLLLAATLVVTLFPPVALVNPLYRLYLEIHELVGINLLNSYAGMIIPYVALTLPLSIFILTTFFASIPTEIEEAAKADGATPWQAFSKIVVPLAAPGVGAAAILTFVYATNEFLLAYSFAPRDLNVQTVPVFIGTFERVGYENPIGQVMAASVLVSIPLVIFVLIMQRWIVSGLTSGAVKG